MITILGLLAGLLSAGCLIPQVIKTYKTKSAHDFAYLYLVFLDLGVILWVLYGALNRDWPIVIANSFGTIFISYILSVKLKTA